MHTEFWIAQLAAHQSVERVVLALGMAAQISACAFLVGFAVDARGLIVRVAHAGRREPGQPRIEIGAQFRGRHQLPDAHPIGALTTPREASLARAVGVGELPVGIDPQRTLVRHLFELVGTQLHRLPGQKSFGLLHRIDGYGLRKIADECLNHPQVLTVEHAIPPGFGGGRQLRRQLLAGEGQARRELFDVAHPAAGLGAADPQPVGDHLVDRAAHVGRILLRHSRDHVVTHRNLPPSSCLHSLQRAQPDGGGQRVEVELGEDPHSCVERV